MQDEQSMVDPLQAGQPLKQRQHVSPTKDVLSGPIQPLLVVKHLPDHVVHRHKTEQAGRVVRRGHGDITRLRVDRLVPGEGYYRPHRPVAEIVVPARVVGEGERPHLAAK